MPLGEPVAASDLTRWRPDPLTGVKRAVEIETKEGSWNPAEDKDRPLSPRLAAVYDSTLTRKLAQLHEDQAVSDAADYSVALSLKHGRAVVALWDSEPGLKGAIDERADGLWIGGYASTWQDEASGTTIERDAFDESLKSYRANPILLLNHSHHKLLGSVKTLATDDFGVYIEGVVPRPEPDEEAWRITAYRDIRRGDLRGLSVGGRVARAANDRHRILKVDLGEISLTSLPLHRGALLGPKAAPEPILPTASPETLAYVQQWLRDHPEEWRR